jgi:iron complex transport system substrate-binding protein
MSSGIAEQVGLRDTFESAGIKTAYFKVETFEDYAAMMKIFTDITGDKDSYQTNVEDVRSDIAAQIARADGSSPTILFLRAYSTGVKAQGSDTMTGQMLKELGCVNIADSEDSLLKDLNMEAIIAADPDYIFVTTMGESKEAALKMVDELLISNPAWSGLTAVKENRYHVLPKELFHMKPNNRWGESYQILADYLYGEK